MRNLVLCFLLSGTGMLLSLHMHANEATAEIKTPLLNQSQLNAIAQTLQVEYQVLDNTSQLSCATTINNGQCFTARLSYHNGATAIPQNVQIYFSHIAPIVSVNSKQVTIEHVNGDLHKLTFVKGLAANARLSFEIMAPFWHASRSDVMPNHYLVFNSLAMAGEPTTQLEPEIIASTTRIRDASTGIEYAAHAGNWQKQQQYRRRADDHLPLENPQQLFARYPDWPELARGNNSSRTAAIRPIPNVLLRADSGEHIKLTAVHLTIDADNHWLNNAQPLALQPAMQVLKEAGLTESPQGVLVAIALDNKIANPDAYQLHISKQRIGIQAATPIGAAYALLTLSQLYNSETHTLPITQINDAPRFGFRGLHLDVARHFLSKQAIETALAQMFRLKMNKLHLHLSDDEGWRLAIPSLPELTEIGGFRCHDLQENHCLLPQLGSGPHKNATGNGFLSVAEYQDLLIQAKSYGIEVIPSFDMPGHARAAVKAMEARYRQLMAAGKPQQAQEFLLADPQDPTDYLSVQFYRDNTMNPCMDSSYHFIETVLRDIQTMHKQAGVPLQTYHLGADETAGAWKQSPICAAKRMNTGHLLPYFVARVVEIGNNMGLVMAGWSDGMEESLSQLNDSRFSDDKTAPGNNPPQTKTQVNIWDTLYWGAANKVEAFSRQGVPVVLSLPDVLYFDFPYRSYPPEPGYYWGSRSVSTRKVFQFMPEQLRRMADVWPDRFGNPYNDDASVPDSSGATQHRSMHPVPVIRGMQAQLWTEVTPTQQAMEYMLFPRLFAFAERAWHFPDWQQPQLQHDELAQKRLADWYSFAGSMVHSHIPRLVKQGVNVRIAPPGATIHKGKLHMKSALPGLALQYSNDGINWLHYQVPVAVNSPVWVRSQLPHTGRFSAVDKIK